MFKKYVILFVLVTLCLLITNSPDVGAARLSTAGETKTETAKPVEQKVTIDFRDVDLKVVAKFISELLGKNFIFDQQVKGKVTIYSPSKVTPAEAYKMFESVLEVHGYTTVPSGKYIKIIPSLKAKTKAIETRGGEAITRPASDRVVTQLIRLNHARASDIRKLLAPLLAKSGVLISYDAGNILIITDFASNIQRLQGIIRSVDVEGEGLQLALIPLKYASARDLARELGQLIKARGKPTATRTFNLVADERTNTLIILHGPGQLKQLKDLIVRLDTPAPRGADKVHVYFLENAVAEELSKVLNSLAGGSQSAQSAAKGSAQRRVLLQDPVTIVADKSTNSLIIRAELQDYQVLESVIKKLDIQRAQVLVEGLIMELTFQKTLQLGAEWRALDQPSTSSDQIQIFGGTNLTGLLNQMSLQPFASASGLVLGAARGTLSWGATPILNLGLLIQALQGDSEVNILSTPHLLTMDNEEATIIVGEERPFLKSSMAQSSSGNVPTVTNTYDFKDLGITLKITPHISQGKFVKLNVFLQIKNFMGEAETGAITSTKRETTTTVLVADRETVVIGGLIRDDSRSQQTGVPCLSEMPGLGWLFKNKTKSGGKTNLLILLTPTIIRSPDQLRQITLDKQRQTEEARKLYEQMKKDRVKDTIEIIKE